jgi:hypothetical protein
MARGDYQSDSIENSAVDGRLTLKSSQVVNFGLNLNPMKLLTHKGHVDSSKPTADSKFLEDQIGV